MKNKGKQGKTKVKKEITLEMIKLKITEVEDVGKRRRPEAAREL